MVTLYRNDPYIEWSISTDESSDTALRCPYHPSNIPRLRLTRPTRLLSTRGRACSLTTDTPMRPAGNVQRRAHLYRVTLVYACQFIGISGYWKVLLLKGVTFRAWKVVIVTSIGGSLPSHPDRKAGPLREPIYEKTRWLDKRSPHQ